MVSDAASGDLWYGSARNVVCPSQSGDITALAKPGIRAWRGYRDINSLEIMKSPPAIAAASSRKQFRQADMLCTAGLFVAAVVTVGFMVLTSGLPVTGVGPVRWRGIFLLPSADGPRACPKVSASVFATL